MSQPAYAAPVYPTENAGPRSGLLYLRDAVADYFADNVIAATVAPVGLKYRSFTLNQSQPANANRVCFIPGVFDGENLLRNRDYGTLSRDTDNSASVVNPREIVAWDRPFTLSVWSAPALGQSDNEGLSVALAEDLLEQVLRAITHAPDPSVENEGGSIAASVIWGAMLLKAPPNESAFGAEILVQATQRAPFLDVTLDVAQATAVIPRTGA